ncbi:MAG: hypothetical protein A2275_11705 [Bacteroidetes bacterium RIFOXYA12_FULL_35_11]|nr:MAG: hypothetical protein A2X01_09525 [Bacteroidetes bacterium GWF2_35_48]OFY72653.1 MAG: hypothetical protein A2275_11705 [Bacteroidetes bacterium RIFOXYA12_FULL_35_11]OFZ00255.1 MAG: hypothetical protein A2491_14815 [Bacteroidetes bacterium RIFOXYC12_FULL_35_7]HBX50161.1 hypothetical protein [Bacteroidales bacterium]
MTKMILRYFFPNFFFLIFLCSDVFAQDFIDLFSAGSNIVPKNKYETTEGSFRMVSSYINLQYPHVFKNKDIFLTKVSFNNYNIKDDSTVNLYITYLQLGVQKNFNDKTSLKLSVVSKMANQLTDIDKNDFVFPCTAMLQHKKSENFTYGFGLFYSREMFGHFMFPIIHAKWKINDAWFFYADFPIYGYLMYYPKEKFKTGIYISTSTNSIRLAEKYNNNYIQKSYADFSLFFDYYFTKHIVLRAKGGYSIMRSMDMYSKDETVPLTFSAFKFGDNRTQLNDNIHDAPFFEISLIYRYHY